MVRLGEQEFHLHNRLAGDAVQLGAIHRWHPEPSLLPLSGGTALAAIPFFAVSELYATGS